jgi:hypothetical protein
VAGVTVFSSSVVRSTVSPLCASMRTQVSALLPPRCMLVCPSLGRTMRVNPPGRMRQDWAPSDSAKTRSKTSRGTMRRWALWPSQVGACDWGQWRCSVKASPAVASCSRQASLSALLRLLQSRPAKGVCKADAG